MPKVIIGVDVDTQIDFVEENGALYVSAEANVRQNIGKLTQELDYKIGSVDSHAYDAWEFSENGGPFPAHCVKGTEGWLKIPESRSVKMRFIPMSEQNLVIGENQAHSGNRKYGPDEFSNDVMNGVQVIFEKEVYSMFANPNADAFIKRLTEKISSDEILFAVYGYCTGGYCVDAAALGLKERGYNVAIVEDATASLNISNQGAQQNGAKVTRSMANEKGILLLKTSDLLN